jgi:hypothetical protein
VTGVQTCALPICALRADGIVIDDLVLTATDLEDVFLRIMTDAPVVAA